MAFGDIVQEAHAIATGTVASLSPQFTNPTQDGNSIIILITKGLSGLPTGVYTYAHANWSFTDRTYGSTSGSSEGRLADALNAMVGFGPVVITPSASFTIGQSVHMYEVDTSAEGATFQTVGIGTYGEGYNSNVPWNHKLGVDFGRSAFVLYAREFATNSTSWDYTKLWKPDYSSVWGMPRIYERDLHAAVGGSVYGVVDVFHEKYNLPLPNPLEMFTFSGVTGAGVESGSVLGQYVEGTTAQTTLTTSADLYGGAGSWAPRANTRSAVWSTIASSVAVTKPTGTVSGDGVFLVALFAGPPGTLTWPAGFTELDSGGFAGAEIGADDVPYRTEYLLGETPPGAGTNTIANCLNWGIASKEAGASEPASYTVSRSSNGYSGYLFAFTIVGMPAASQQLVQETGGTASYPEGTEVAAVPSWQGNEYLGMGYHPGGTRDDWMNRPHARQRARSRDYFVLLISNTAWGLTNTGITTAPPPDATIAPVSGGGFEARIYQRGSDEGARVNAQTYYSNVNPATTDTLLSTWSYVKAFVIGVPFNPTADEAVLDIAPLVAAVKQLPYDLRDLKLGGELT